MRNQDAVVAACAGMDVVYHVAGVAGIWGPWEHYYGINTLGTRNVLAGCRIHRVAKLVYTSSPSVTFDGQPQAGVDESVPYASRWLCHYPHSKALAEAEVLAANGPDLATCALRPHLIWGPRDQHLVPRLLRRAQAGTAAPRRGRHKSDRHGLCRKRRGGTSVGRRRAATGFAPGRPEAYFISQGAPVNCWGWIDELLALAGLPAVRRSISLPAAWAIGSVCEALYAGLRIGREPPMTRFLAAQLGCSHYFDISGARADFGYQPAISIEEGMRRLADRLAAASGKPIAQHDLSVQHA